jgi:hypothetical protein
MESIFFVNDMVVERALQKLNENSKNSTYLLQEVLEEVVYNLPNLGTPVMLKYKLKVMCRASGKFVMLVDVLKKLTEKY